MTQSLPLDAENLKRIRAHKGKIDVVTISSILKGATFEQMFESIRGIRLLELLFQDRREGDLA